MNHNVRAAAGGNRDVPASVRHHYMDNLRAIAMLAGIFFHAALAYSPIMANLWIGASPGQSVPLDALAWFSHLFRMPLFFLIAGFFSCYLIHRRGTSGLLRNRALRIALPLVIFLPLTWVSAWAVFDWAVDNVQNPSPLLQFVELMAGIENAPELPVSTVHLWFLYYLCQLYVLYVVLRAIKPLFSRLMALLSSVPFLILAAPLLLIPALATQIAPHPAPEQLTPRPWAINYFGVFFLIGVALFRRPALLDELRRYVPGLFVLSVALYALFYTLLPDAFEMQDVPRLQAGVEITPNQLGVAALEAFISVHMTLVCLVAGKAFLDSASRINRFIADSSYWVYIIHLPVLFWLQLLLLDKHWNVYVEFLLSSFGTLAIGMVSYVLLVRWTPIGWLLNGKRKAKVHGSTG